LLAIGAFTLIGMNQFAGTRIGTISLATGNNTNSHFVDWRSVSVGDCLQSTGGLTVELSKCNTPHHWQVFAQADSQSVSYDVEAISAEGDKICRDAEANLDAAAVNKINPAPVESVYYPSSPSWDQGDRQITCLIGSQDSTIDTTLIKP
jgi:hypothetical protein